MIRVVSFVIALLFCGTNVQDACLCRLASDDERPIGANVYVELREVTMSELRGVVIGPDESPAEDAVVEIYLLDKRVTKLPRSHITAELERLTARITDEGGRFCFPDLKPGKYFVVAGLREHGVNAIHAVVEIQHSATNAANVLTLRLSMGS